MSINIIAASKIKKNSPYFELIEEYLKRLSSLKINIIEFDEKNLSQTQINQKIFSYVGSKSFVIMCDESGIAVTTRQFKSLLFGSSSEAKNSFPTKILETQTNIAFLIGGADGFLPQYKQKSQLLLSLSNLTLPHQMARLVLIEQIYRAYTIYQKHPYHRN